MKATPLLVASAMTLWSLDALGVAAQTKNDRPRLVLRALPSVAVTPARVVFTAELVGGSDDFAEYYCPEIEWDWDDGTHSESATDCEPFETGKTSIRRRYTVEHIFRNQGPYKIYFRMKRKEKAIATASVTVQIQPGASPEFQ